jgi:hypothetical protein
VLAVVVVDKEISTQVQQVVLVVVEQVERVPILARLLELLTQAVVVVALDKVAGRLVLVVQVW